MTSQAVLKKVQLAQHTRPTSFNSWPTIPIITINIFKG